MTGVHHIGLSHCVRPNKSYVSKSGLAFYDAYM